MFRVTEWDQVCPCCCVQAPNTHTGTAMRLDWHQGNFRKLEKSTFTSGWCSRHRIAGTRSLIVVKKSFWCSMLVSVYINTLMKLYMSRPSLTLLHAKKRKVWSEVLSSLFLSLLWGKGQGSRAGLQLCSPRKMLINFEAILDERLFQLFFFFYKIFISFGHFSWVLKAQWIFESLETNGVKFDLWCLFIFLLTMLILCLTQSRILLITYLCSCISVFLSLPPKHPCWCNHVLDKAILLLESS